MFPLLMLTQRIGTTVRHIAAGLIARVGLLSHVRVDMVSPIVLIAQCFCAQGTAQSACAYIMNAAHTEHSPLIVACRLGALLGRWRLLELSCFFSCFLRR